MSRYDHVSIPLLLSESLGIRLSPRQDGWVEVPPVEEAFSREMKQ